MDAGANHKIGKYKGSDDSSLVMDSGNNTPKWALDMQKMMKPHQGQATRDKSPDGRKSRDESESKSPS